MHIIQADKIIFNVCHNCNLLSQEIYRKIYKQNGYTHDRHIERGKVAAEPLLALHPIFIALGHTGLVDLLWVGVVLEVGE